jgi:hypothetical protein
MGLVLSMLISYISYLAHKKNEVQKHPSGHDESTNQDNKSSGKNPSTPPPAKLKSVLRKVFSPVGADGSEERSSMYQSESVNTVYNLDDFMIRLFKTGFVVKRVKPGEKKIRCLKIDSQARLCLYKQFDEKEIVLPIGKPYLRMNFVDLQDSFICEEDNKSAFILDFKEKTLLFTASIPLDAAYLVEGFKNLMQRLKVDKNYLQYCIQRYREIRPGGGSANNTPTKYHADYDDDSIATGSTYNTAGSRYSWSSRSGQRNITRIK